MAERRGGKSPRSAKEKALLVLDVLSEQPQPIGLPDLSERIALPRQTVHRILLQLEKTGLIVRTPLRDRFSVGPRLSQLALSALYSRNQGAPVGGVLQRLVDDVRETCNVGILHGMEFIYLERIECDWDLRIHLSAGGRLPAHCAAGGKVMLAYLPSSLRARLLASADLEPRTEKTITSAAELEKACAEIRERGYALNIEEFAIGVAAVSVPILDRRGRVLAALAMHGPSARIPVERAIERVPRLQAAAQSLARAWGIAD